MLVKYVFEARDLIFFQTTSSARHFDCTTDCWPN